MNAGDDGKVLKGCDFVILLGHLTPGGNERQGYLLARALTAAGYRVGVIVWTLTCDDFYLGLLNDSGIPLAKAPQGRGALAKVRWLRRVVREVRPSVLHAYTFFLNAAAAWAMAGVKGIAVGSMRGDYAIEAPNGRLHYTLNRLLPRTLIANSENARNNAAKDRSLFRPRQVLFVRNGLDCSAYSVRQHQVCHPRVIGVGNLYPGKRWDRLIQAVALIRNRQPELTFSVDIVGEGGERGRLAALIDSLDLKSHVRLLGRRYDVPALLAASDVFVLVSDSEGTPNAVMEAMSSGLPVVATAVGDIPRLVEDGRHGFLVPITDDEKLASAVQALINDSELRSRLGCAAAQKAAEEFTLELLVQNTLDAYRHAGWAGPSRPSFVGNTKVAGNFEK